jgi:hypothetical protein
LNEATWLSSENPAEMLAYVADKIGPRRLRLFAAGLVVALPESELRPQVEAMADDPVAGACRRSPSTRERLAASTGTRSTKLTR